MAELASHGSLVGHAYIYHQFDWSEAESGALNLKRGYKNSLQDSACLLFYDVTIGLQINLWLFEKCHVSLQAET